ncbi:hypothetical protein HDU97_004149 [Phlyctochytrium planicorne]|nr:hypothetical protein HDU97_004149 [Phlyctochytrium planicorne]
MLTQLQLPVAQIQTLDYNHLQVPMFDDGPKSPFHPTSSETAMSPPSFFAASDSASIASPFNTPSPYHSPFQIPIAVPVSFIPVESFGTQPSTFHTPTTMYMDEERVDAYSQLLSSPSSPLRGPQQNLSIPSSPLSLRHEEEQDETKPEIDCHLKELPTINLSKSSTSHESHCHFCDTTLGLLIFYPDTKNSSSPSHHIDVACMSCVEKQLHMQLPSAKEFPNTVSASVSDLEAEQDLSLRKRRAKGIRANQTIYCEACNKKIGFGGVRGNPESGERANVEPVCASCVLSFDLCTQCGGGGTFRTGKWRPRQLFDDGRKTCSLSHDRIGAIDSFQVTTYKCPNRPIEDASGRLVDSSFDPCPVVAHADEKITKCLRDPNSSIYRGPRGRKGSAKSMSAFSRFSSVAAATASGVEIIRKRRDQFLKMNELRLMAYWATPAFMASYEGLVGTWDKLEAYSDDWNRQLNDFMVGIKSTTCTSRPDGSRRFIVVTDSLRSGKKVSSKKGAEEQVDLLLVGYFFFDWNPFERTVHLSQMYYDGKDSLVGSSDLEGQTPLPFMFDAMMERIRSEIIADGMLPEPQHVWVTMPKAALAERNRMVHHVEKLGFLPLGKYCRRNEYEMQELKAKFSMVGSEEGGEDALMTTLAIKWTELKRRM